MTSYDSGQSLSQRLENRLSSRLQRSSEDKERKPRVYGDAQYRRIEVVP
jgi:hypothetical protein